MEELCRRSGLNDLDIVLGGEPEKAFQAGAGMFRPSPFETMREKEHDTTQPPPLVFGSGDELIHDHLAGVPEIAVLRLPCNETVGTIQAVAVFETENAGLG